MARGINKVILIGNLGADPELRTMNNGNPLATLSLATSESWKDAAGERQERTEWHRVVCFNKLAEIVGQYVKKGGKIYVEGSLKTRKWQDQQGQDRYTTEVVASDIQMLDSKGGFNNSGGYENMSQASESQPSAFDFGNKQTKATGATADSLAGLDDDIPF